jgi:Ca2+-binding RTX toxin-like protein
VRLAAVLLAVLAASVFAGGTGAAPGCSPRHAAAKIKVTRYCIVGTDRADLIVGSAAGDLIYGWAGADRIFGRGGDDRIFAGSGNDVVYGGAGDDLIDPALGNDHVYGGPGNDVLRTAGGERDWVSCGPGYDVAHVDKLDVVAKDCEKVVVTRGYS